MAAAATTAAPAPEAAPQAAAAAGPSTTNPPVIHRLRAVPLTPEAFAPFGRVIGAKDDGAPFSAETDALLDLSQGPPRLYVMRLPERGRAFHRITYHARVTQCLGSVQPGVRWYLCVAKATGSCERFPRPGDVTAFAIPHGVLVQLRAGTWHAGPLFDGGLPLGAPPADAAEACARAREGEAGGGAGGAGPGAGAGAGAGAAASGGLFLDFFNLELTDTNVTDHNTHDYSVLGDGEGAPSGVSFEVVDE